MEILILGGTRVFGPALIAKLYEKTAGSAQITCFHRALHGGADAFGQVKHIIGNRYDRQAVTSVFRERRDLVVDLSGTDEEMIRISMDCAQDRCRRYVFVSSSSVYTVNKDTESKSAPSAHREDEPVCSGTGDAYALAKIKGEQLLRDRFPHFTVIRPSKVYGPGNYYFSEWSILQMLRERSVIELEGDPILHFTYIDDLAEGICALLEKDGIFNVAGAEPARLSRFISLIGELHGIRPQFVTGRHSNVPFSGLSDRVLDLSAAKKAAGWAPAVPLKEGLEKTFSGAGSYPVMSAQDRPQ